jgi:hypothetical protein
MQFLVSNSYQMLHSVVQDHHALYFLRAGGNQRCKQYIKYMLPPKKIHASTNLLACSCMQYIKYILAAIL